MGFWGAKLYSGDFALDLRSAVAAVARLPLDEAELVAALRAGEAAAADDPKDPDHTTFWLVLADQFARRGVFPAEVRARALAIIGDGSDLANLRALGAGPGDLKARSVQLDAIRQALETPAAKPRKTLKAPQPFVFEPGEVIGFPTSKGRQINPYFKSKALIRGWSQDGWASAVVAQAEHEFGYLAWYRLLVPMEAQPERPTMASAWAEPNWALRRPGTCSRLHRTRMEIETVGHVRLDVDALARLRPEFLSIKGRAAAVSDISIANHMNVAPAGGWARAVAARPGSTRSTIGRLAEVAKP